MDNSYGHIFPSSFFKNDGHEIVQLCNGNFKHLCYNDGCEYCFKRSLISHERGKYLSKINKISPRYIPQGRSDKKYLFHCDKCPHTFMKTPAKITDKKDPRWCPYCCIGTQLLCNKWHCGHCFLNSFASKEQSKYWNCKKNKTIPRLITKRTGTKYWFTCESGHEFRISPDNIGGGKWCRRCKNKTEGKLEKILQSKNYLIDTQIIFE